MCILSITYSASTTENKKYKQEIQEGKGYVCLNDCILICKIFWAEIAAIVIITTTIIKKPQPTMNQDFGTVGTLEMKEGQ